MHLFEFQEYREKIAETIQQLVEHCTYGRANGGNERKSENLSQMYSKSIISKLQF